MLCRLYQYACGDPAQNECIRLYGIPEREKQCHGLRAVWGFEIQTQELGLLVQRLHVDTVDKNTAKIQDYTKHQLEEDKMGEQLSIPYPGSPFTGRK